MSRDSLHSSPLGKTVSYTTHYDPDLLFPLERHEQRQKLQLPQRWYGEDIWHGYELSWLEPSQKPAVGLARFRIPHDSPCLIESKSLKLYLNSLNETVFTDRETLRNTVQKDLSATAQSEVAVEIFDVQSAASFQTVPLSGTVIDQAEFQQRHDAPAPEHLRCDHSKPTGESLVSHLLKSNCLITGQPDWGSLLIRYQGPQIDHGSLLEYIVSYRNHNEFHEHCVERIFCDILQQCQPESLLVQAFYTRRGGLDINPWRSTHPQQWSAVRTLRQ